VAQPGDVIAVESPTFYAALRAIERLGMKALEVPTHAREGIDLGALAAALKREAVKACWLMPTFQNPLGCLMPEDTKRDLVRLLARHGVPLIEDDEELYFGAERPRPAKAFDKAGLVLHCSSFTKSLAPGYRIGWTSAGRYAPRIERDKWITNLTTNMPAQAAIAHYLRHGGFDHHLRKLRTLLRRQRDQMTEALTAFLPPDSRITRPEGSYFVWVELGAEIDSVKVYRSCLAAGISVAPGPVFSGQGHKYRNCLRLNYGHPWSPRTRNAVATLGEIARGAA
jgi:DNA-binding transcriptional MocR family regulator